MRLALDMAVWLILGCRDRREPAVRHGSVVNFRRRDSREALVRHALLVNIRVR